MAEHGTTVFFAVLFAMAVYVVGHGLGPVAAAQIASVEHAHAAHA